MDKGLETTNAGLKYCGNWDEVCDFARDLEEVLKEYVPKSRSIDNFHKWRPREDDDEEDVAEKTAEGALPETRKVEEDFRGTKEEIKGAEEDLKEAVEDVKNGEDPSQDFKEASKHIGRLVGAKSMRSLREAERNIYERIILKLNPYYFDEDDFSINLDRKGDLYILTVNIKDEENRRRVFALVKKDMAQKS